MGYTKNEGGNSSSAVINQYFHEHFPKAIKIGKEFRQRNESFQYKWMTQSWLVSAYRRCNETKVNILGPDLPSNLQCPSAEELEAFEESVRAGDITYHAFPFNAEPEMYSPELFDAALNLTFSEDDYFGLQRKRTLSQRDVPGMTRSVIPLLTKRGIVAISVGENSQCAPLNVPPLFLWRDNATNTEIIALFHGLGYGGSWPDRRRRMYDDDDDAPAFECDHNRTCQDDPSNHFYIDGNGLKIAKSSAMPWDDGPSVHVDENQRVILGSNDRKSEACVTVTAARVALCYAWKVDNSGPHGVFQVDLIRDKLKLLYPGANIVSSNAFDDFVEAIWPFKSTLPIVTAELGDTWVMGLNADPIKVAFFRAAQREYSACISKGKCLDEDRLDDGAEFPLRTFERLLMTCAEHTYGWNGGSIRRKSWSNEELEKSRLSDPDFQTAELTWQEQRAFLFNALDALPTMSPLRQSIEDEWDAIRDNATFDFAGDSRHAFVDLNVEKIVRVGEEVRCGEHAMLSFLGDGSIAAVRAIASNRTWRGSFAAVSYQNIDRSFIEDYAREYVAGWSAIDPDLAAENLVKPNMNLPSMNANATLIKIRRSISSDSILLDLGWNDDGRAHEQRGAYGTAQALITCDDALSEDELHISFVLRWHNKTTTHAPETIWLSHSLEQTSAVHISKLGQYLDATDADLPCDDKRKDERLTCGVHLHGVDDGGVLMKSETALAKVVVASLDSALVSVGVKSPLPTPLRVPETRNGKADSSSQFRFSLGFSSFQ
eukprot:g3394.t1